MYDKMSSKLHTFDFIVSKSKIILINIKKNNNYNFQFILIVCRRLNNKNIIIYYILKANVCQISLYYKI